MNALARVQSNAFAASTSSPSSAPASLPSVPTIAPDNMVRTPTPIKVNIQRLSGTSLMLREAGYLTAAATGTLIPATTLSAASIAVMWGLGTRGAIEQIRRSGVELRNLERTQDLIDKAVRDMTSRDGSAVGMQTLDQNAGALEAILQERRVDTNFTRYVSGYTGAVGTGIVGGGLLLSPVMLGQLSPTVILAGTGILYAGFPLLIGFSAGMAGLRATRAVQATMHGQALRDLGEETPQRAFVHDLLQQRQKSIVLYNSLSTAALISSTVGGPLTVFVGPFGLALLAGGVVGIMTVDYFQRQRVGYEPQIPPASKLELDDVDAIVASIIDAHGQHALLKSLKEMRRDVYYWGRESPMGPVFRAKNWWRKRREGRPSQTADAETIVWSYAAGRAQQVVFYLEALRHVTLRSAREATQAGEQEHAAALDARAQRYEAAQVEHLKLGSLVAAPADTPAESLQQLVTWLDGMGLDIVVAKRLGANPAWQDVFANPESPDAWTTARESLAALPADEQPVALAMVYEACEAELFTDEKRRSSYRQRELLDYLLARLEKAEGDPIDARGGVYERISRAEARAFPGDG